MRRHQINGNGHSGNGRGQLGIGFQVKLSPNGNGFVFHPERGEMFFLNRAGAMAYRLYQGGVSSDKIARHLTRRYSAPAERVVTDVRDFLVQVRAYGVTLDH
jgi:hypothetical protein